MSSIVRLSGGIGNQMFQYAFGKNIEVKYKLDIKYDVSDFETDELREYSLGIFNTMLNFENDFKLAKFEKKHSRIFKLFKYFQSLFPISFRFYIEQDLSKNIKEYLNLNFDNKYFSGYWQSDEFFDFSKDIIRTEFKFNKKLDSDYLKIIKQFKRFNLVSVHVRRGDYVNNSFINSKFGTCPISYYKKAFNFIVNYVDDVFFVVFSDDLIWAKNFFKDYKNIIFANSENKEDFQDLYLMSLCQHHILANSSFSWWGAWLGKNPKKIIIAPKKWVLDKNWDYSDLIPKNWIRL
jgi:hypothetical protein